MRIVSISPETILEIPFLNAGKGQGAFYVDHLPVLTAEVDELPPSLDAVVATADLQGRERFEEMEGGPPRLLGEVLPKRMAEEVLPPLGIAAERTAVVMAGDFYTVPGLDKRGGSGDVTRVWTAFGQHFKWAAGVPGNHDTFGKSIHPATRLAHNLHYIDNDRVTVDGIRIAGLGGIIGNPRRPHRRTDQEFAKCLDDLLNEPNDLVVMHDGPDVPTAGLRGSSLIRHALERRQPTLVVRGHAYWKQPLFQLDQGTTILNVDSRVVIMRSSVSRQSIGPDS